MEGETGMGHVVRWGLVSFPDPPPWSGLGTRLGRGLFLELYLEMCEGV